MSTGNVTMIGSVFLSLNACGISASPFALLPGNSQLAARDSGDAVAQTVTAAPAATPKTIAPRPGATCATPTTPAATALVTHRSGGQPSIGPIPQRLIS